MLFVVKSVDSRVLSSYKVTMTNDADQIFADDKAFILDHYGHEDWFQGVGTGLDSSGKKAIILSVDKDANLLAEDLIRGDSFQSTVIVKSVGPVKAQ